MLSSPPTRGVALLLAGVPCVLAVVTYGELSGGALVAVTATGLVLTGLGLAARAGAGAAAVGRAARPWLLWLVVALGWELVTFVDDDLPTLSDLLDPVLAHRALRGAATVAWLAVGAWLLARPGHSEAQP